MLKKSHNTLEEKFLHINYPFSSCSSIVAFEPHSLRCSIRRKYEKLRNLLLCFLFHSTEKIWFGRGPKILCSWHNAFLTDLFLWSLCIFHFGNYFIDSNYRAYFTTFYYAFISTLQKIMKFKY